MLVWWICFYVVFVVQLTVGHKSIFSQFVIKTSFEGHLGFLIVTTFSTGTSTNIPAKFLFYLFIRLAMVWSMYDSD